MRQQLATSDAAIARVAARQHGIITFAQLLEAGLSRSGIARRVAAGRLHRVFRGVYAVGHRGLSNEGRWMAAVLACGEGAVLSHRSAAEIWALLPILEGPIHVTLPSTTGRARRTGVRLHRTPSLPADATTVHKRIAVTTPARTLLDLRRVAPPGIVRNATRQAEFLGLDLGEIETDRTRSDSEADLLRLCRRHRIPPPEVNVPIGPYTVDFIWRPQRLVVEIDGWAAHRGRQAFEDDRARELELSRRGFRVRRFSARQVSEQPGAVADAICAELASCGRHAGTTRQ